MRIAILNDNTLVEVEDRVMIGDAIGDGYVIGLLPMLEVA